MKEKSSSEKGSGLLRVQSKKIQGAKYEELAMIKWGQTGFQGKGKGWEVPRRRDRL